MALTLTELYAIRDAIQRAKGSPVLRVHAPDGKDITYRSMDELLKAEASNDEAIRTYGNHPDSKSTLAQHRRGDGPYGPGFPGPPGWGYW
jgi:hypothetical protein